MRPISAIITAALLALAAPAAGAQASFRGLGDLPGGAFASRASAVSADGSVVVGTSPGANGADAFRWTEPTGMVALPRVPGSTGATAEGVSSDGAVVVGGGSGAWRWTAQGGTVPLAPLPGGGLSDTEGVSGDGTVAIGVSEDAEGDDRAVRWAPGVQVIPGASAGSVAFAISSDGSTVVGKQHVGSLVPGGPDGHLGGIGLPFRWTAGGGMSILPLLPGGQEGNAFGVSPDGAVVVGLSDNAQGVDEAFRWTATTGTVGLGDLPGGQFFSAAEDTDGETVVGFSASAIAFEAFVWTEADGMRGIKAVLEDDHGLDLTGWTLTSALDISADGTTIVGYGTNPQGQPEGWRAVLPLLALVSPTPGAVVVGGERFRIRWRAPSSIALVDLVLLPDTLGAFPLLVAAARPAADTAYTWAVPDDLFSRSARLVVRRAGDPTVADTSGYFHVKPYHLTRLTSDGVRYDPFRPDRHGWPFANTTATLFPPEWQALPQFDYAGGADPFAGLPYPPDFPQPPVNAAPPVFSDWPAYVRAYGTDDAYWFVVPGDEAVYRDAFTVAWGAYHGGRAHNGSCSGMAVSSLLAFGHREAFGVRYPAVGPVERLFTVGMSVPVREMANTLYSYWGGTVQRAHRAAIGSTTRTPRQTLADLKARLLSDSRNADSYLYIASGAPGGGAHAVVPYGLNRDPAVSGRWRVRVYDPNWPADSTQAVLVDSLSDEWLYAGGLNWGGSTGMYVMDPAPNYLTETGFPGLLPLDAPPAAGPASLYVAATPGANVRLASAAGAVGYANGAVFNTLPGAAPDVPPVGGPTPPIGYDVPPGPYAVTMAAFPDSPAAAYVFGPGSVYAYGRADADTNQTDRLTYDPAAGLGGGLTAASADAGVTKTVVLRAVLSANTGPERTLDAADLPLTGTDSVAFAAIDGAAGPRLRLANGGGAKTYTLRLRQADSAGETRFRHLAVPLAGGATHVVRPVWATLGSGPVEVDVDLDSDGVPDEVLVLENQPVATEPVPAGGAPTQLALHAPAPNPASGSVTIRYDTPTAGTVRLALYDALGRQVAVLVDGERPAGVYDAVVDAGTLAPGFYIARLTAGGHELARTLTVRR